MAMSGGKDDGAPMMEMNMTPLIDVLLVLLIMFIITIPVATHAVNIDFVDEAARDVYLSELDHDRVGIRLSEMTEGGLGGILIMNINIDNISTPQKGSDKKPELRWE